MWTDVTVRVSFPTLLRAVPSKLSVALLIDDDDRDENKISSRTYPQDKCFGLFYLLFHHLVVLVQATREE